MGTAINLGYIAFYHSPLTPYYNTEHSQRSPPTSKRASRSKALQQPLGNSSVVHIFWIHLLDFPFVFRLQTVKLGCGERCVEASVSALSWDTCCWKCDAYSLTLWGYTSMLALAVCEGLSLSYLEYRNTNARWRKLNLVNKMWNVCCY